MYFFSDLDNTLVYSHRVALPEDAVVAEHLNGRVQSRMTARTHAFLKNARGLEIVPVTTRTREQYARLSGTLSELGCRYALVCNGGILLDGDRVDADWLEQTQVIAGDGLRALREAHRLFLGHFPEERVRFSDELLLYASCDDPGAAAAELSAVLDPDALNVFHDSRKVYCIPASIDKGCALKRFSARMGTGFCAAAGDSPVDVPMLEAADVAILPASLSDRVANARRFVADPEACFSDHICNVLEGLLNDKAL